MSAELVQSIAAPGIATTLITVNVKQMYRLLRQRQALDAYAEASRNGWDTTHLASIISATGDGRRIR